MDQEKLINGVYQGLASIQISPLEETDSDGKFIEPEDGRITWGPYKLVNRYFKDLHKYALAIATEQGIPESQNTVAIVTLSRSTLIWVCTWTAEKTFVKPEVPNPISTNPLWELLDEYYNLDEVVVAADGDTPVYRIGGTYIYACLRPSAVTINDLQFPRPPWFEDVFSRTVDPDQLRSDLSEIPGNNLRRVGNQNNPPFRRVT